MRELDYLINALNAVLYVLMINTMKTSKGNRVALLFLNKFDTLLPP